MLEPGRSTYRDDEEIALASSDFCVLLYDLVKNRTVCFFHNWRLDAFYNSRIRYARRRHDSREQYETIRC